MDIRLLKYFLTVANEENITRASEKLHISQPSLSKQLMELEKELGKKLLIRGKRKITLTEEGVFLRKRADEILSLVEKTEQEFESNANDIKGEISIGGTPTEIIIKSATKLREKYPKIKFNFYCGDATDVTERLNHCSLDFAVLLEPVDSTKYKHVSLNEISEWGILMKKSDKLSNKKFITAEDFQGMPIILHKRKGLQEEISKWCGAEIEDLNVVATYNVTQGNPVNLVKNGLGNLVMTRNSLPNNLEKEVCFVPLKPALRVKYALVWNKNPMFSRVAKLFLEEVVNFLKTKYFCAIFKE